MAVIFEQPALTCCSSVSLAFFHVQTMYKDTQKFNNSVWKNDKILMLSLYCQTHCLPLCFSLCHLLFFWPIFPLAAYVPPSLPLQAGEGWLFELQATSDLHSSMSLHLSWCFAHTLYQSYMRDVIGCLNMLWQLLTSPVAFIYQINNQSALSIALNWCCPHMSSITGYLDVIHHRPDVGMMDVTVRIWSDRKLTAKSGYQTKREMGLSLNGTQMRAGQ